MSDRVVAALGALIGIGVTALVSFAVPVPTAALPMLVAPMGASAVLLFALPASPLARPWAVFGGNVISAGVGVAAARWIGNPALAAGAAVGGAIFVMSLCRCLHPPGGAAALTAVIGGPAVAASGFLFPLVPVALNSALLLGAGWLFHRWSGHSYPHRPSPEREPGPVAADWAFLPEDIDRALEDLDDTFDIGREDLAALFRRVEIRAAERVRGRR